MAFIEPMHRNKPNITYLLFLDVVYDLFYDRFWQVHFKFGC